MFKRILCWCSGVTWEGSCRVSISIWDLATSHAVKIMVYGLNQATHAWNSADGLVITGVSGKKGKPLRKAVNLWIIMALTNIKDSLVHFFCRNHDTMQVVRYMILRTIYEPFVLFRVVLEIQTIISLQQWQVVFFLASLVHFRSVQKRYWATRIRSRTHNH